MEKQVKIGNLAHEHESETAKQTLVKSVKATEKRLLKAEKINPVSDWFCNSNDHMSGKV